jgi:hypothetical protein
VAYGRWEPSSQDTCTKGAHDAFGVEGPDGKLYPTWHPPVDPGSGCTFGHEHGRDPSGSDLFGKVGRIPFGYANEQLDVYDPFSKRHEDHVGHKVEWENDVRMKFGSDAASAVFETHCDVLTKMHQGSHSKDAFTNNLHEVVYHIDCSDGTAFGVTMLTAIGTPGEFVRRCDGDVPRRRTLPKAGVRGGFPIAAASRSSCLCARATDRTIARRSSRAGRSRPR